MAMQPRAAALALAAIAGLLLAERLWPLRRRTQAEPRRLLTNAAIGAIALGTVAVVQRPLATALAARVVARRQGLVQVLGPAWLRDAAAFALLDWTTYHWHVATHRVPLLWRLHRVHHVDADMDASTALRFHGIDMLVSVPVRLAQIRLIRASPRALAVWEGWFFASVAFHHANLAVPFDAALAWAVTTPGMHDIHHRAVAGALVSNFSAGLSVWDRVHGTFSDATPDAAIGVPGGGAQGLRAALAMPFAPAMPAPAGIDGPGGR